MNLNTGDESAAQMLMPEPLPLIIAHGNLLKIGDEAMEKLRSVKKPLVVIAIAGLYRTGKSYLLNRLAGTTKGFPLGAAMQGQTRGIWIWVVPHPQDSEKYLALLDTEGLGDVEKGDSNHDAKIFALAILLSSTLIYNSKGNIDQDALDKLHFVTNLTDHIVVNKAEKTDENNLDRFLPAFIWALRDFSLLLEINDNSVTEDEYMEHCLRVKEGTSDAINKYNNVRLKMRNYFKNRKCFIFTRPVFKARDLKVLDQINDSLLDEDFVNGSAAFCKFIYQESRVKLLDNGERVNGSMLVSLADSYIQSINNGAIPCIKDAVESMSLIENQKAVDNAFSHYKNALKTLPLPISVLTLSNAFLKANKDAVKIFLDNSILDIGQKFQRKLGAMIIKANEELMILNSESSRTFCQNLLKQLSQKSLDKLNIGAYSKHGGFKEYAKDMDNIRTLYREIPNKGVKENEVLLEFFEERIDERKNLMAMDMKNREQEMKIAEEKYKADEEKLRTERRQKEKDDIETRKKEQELLYEENATSLIEKLKGDMERLRTYLQELLEERLAEQKRLLKEGHLEKASLLEKQIQRLQNELENLPKKPSCFASTSRVRVKSGDDITIKTLQDLEIGEHVESYDSNEDKIVFSPVYFIVHARSTDEYQIMELATTSRRIQLDHKHLIYCSKSDQHQEKDRLIHPFDPIKAEEVEVGDYLWVRHDDGSSLKAEIVIGKSDFPYQTVRHPITMNHNIIVDDVHASVHMFSERLYRVLTAPLRILYHISPSTAKSPIVEKLVESWDKIEQYF